MPVGSTVCLWNGMGWAELSQWTGDVSQSVISVFRIDKWGLKGVSVGNSRVVVKNRVLEARFSLYFIMMFSYHGICQSSLVYSTPPLKYVPIMYFLLMRE